MNLTDEDKQWIDGRLERLSIIPDADLYAEVARRRAARRKRRSGGRKPSCLCGTCGKCKQREAMRRRRAAAK